MTLDCFSPPPEGLLHRIIASSHRVCFLSMEADAPFCPCVSFVKILGSMHKIQPPARDAHLLQETLALPHNLPRVAPDHVAKASADSHNRRMEAIKAKREQDKADEAGGGSKKSLFKPW